MKCCERRYINDYLSSPYFNLNHRTSSHNVIIPDHWSTMNWEMKSCTYYLYSWNIWQQAMTCPVKRRSESTRSRKLINIKIIIEIIHKLSFLIKLSSSTLMIASNNKSSSYLAQIMLRMMLRENNFLKIISQENFLVNE